MMIKSIRKFLLINLILSLIVITVLSALANYYLNKHEIEHHLDQLQGQSALTIQALLSDQPVDFEQLQANLNNIPNVIQHMHTKSYIDPELNLFSRYQLQVWDKHQNLLLHSKDTAIKPFTDAKSGFRNEVVNGKGWRVFSHYNPNDGIKIELADPLSERDKLIHKLALDNLYIILLVYPIAGLLIWFIIGKGLKSIWRVADEVSHRAPNYLKPVESKSIPSEIKPLVIELNKLFLRLQQALEREKRFAADAAHELRTPLAALKTQAQVALKSTEENERTSMLGNVIRGVDRCTHIVQQLLTLSRLVPEANTLNDMISVNLAKLSAEIVAQLAPGALDKHIDIELVTEDNKARIMGNITALSILIRNLVDNAIRYTPEGGQIKVTVKRKFEKVVLVVSDNGPGIPAELRMRVFERFFRVLGNKSPGSGLGLAIVQQITQFHHGQLRLGPPPSGKGLQVEVTFDRA